MTTPSLEAAPAAGTPHARTDGSHVYLTTMAQILWTSLATGSYYVLFAVAFALVLKVNGVFNFAQAGLMTIAFYTAHGLIAGLALGGPVSFALALGGNACQRLGA